jgi:thiol-disulfide isomerase/thioredoxin
MKSLAGKLVLATAMSVSGAMSPACAGTPGEVEVGQILPDAALRGLNGPAQALSSFRGKPLIINVWASWCGPCRQEMASLERLAWREPTGQFAIIGISTDDYDANALGLLRKSNATISHFIDSDLKLENMLGAARLPLTVLVDSRGKVVLKIYGAREWDAPESLNLISQAFHSPKLSMPR